VKRNISFRIILFVTIAVLFVVMIIHGQRFYEEMLANAVVGEFCLDDYQEEIQIFSVDKNVGPVKDAKTASEKARQIWIEKYGKVDMSEYFGYPEDPSHGSPLQVYYDKTQDCWLIHGTTKAMILMSRPYAIIQSDGTVVAVWRG